jgi:hypothetical protein
MDISYDAWVTVFPPEDVGTDIVRTASRLMPRSVFRDENLRNQTFQAHKDAIETVSNFYEVSLERDLFTNGTYRASSYLVFK